MGNNTKNVKCSMFYVPCSMRENGFSLIEMVVVLAIFLLIIGATVNVLIAVIGQQRRILAEQELLNQASFTTEYISTALKNAVKDPDGTCLGSTGYVYLITNCNNGATQSCSGIKFINGLDGNACEEFYLLNSAGATQVVQAKYTSPATAGYILSNKFIIKYLSFILDSDKTLRAASTVDVVQPKVTMLLDVLTTGTPVQEKVIQTTISQRTIIK